MSILGDSVLLFLRDWPAISTAMSFNAFQDIDLQYLAGRIETAQNFVKLWEIQRTECRRAAQDAHDYGAKERLLVLSETAAARVIQWQNQIAELEAYHRRTVARGADLQAALAKLPPLEGE